MVSSKITFEQTEEDIFCPHCGVVLNKILNKKVEGFLGSTVRVIAVCPNCKKPIPVSP